MHYPFVIEPLELRIAPAVLIANPLFDLTAGVGQTGVSIDLAKVVDSSATHRTFVEFTTNYFLPGATEPSKIVLELFDDKAPLSVQNFLTYVNGKDGANYDGTFFHRIFDFQSDGTTDIIQAGGFDVKNITKHIPTGPTVHNEYVEDDPTLQNVPGTIAMAKTAISPHTGTSEWFINLTDNTTTLGADNNGGFTVFGRIVEGLDVATAIGSAPKINQGGALTDLPVQEGYESGTPKANDLIQIVDAKVITPGAPYSLEGHTFSNPTVTQVGGGAASSLVKAVIVNNELKLTYTPGMTGVAEVTIDITKDNETVQETFTVTIKPNLIAEFASHTLATDFVPGDTGVGKVKVTNNTGGLAKGDVEVRLYLSAVDADGNNQLDPDTFIVDDTDLFLGSKTVSLNLKSGKSVTVPVQYTVAESSGEIVLVNGRQYVVLAEVVPVAGSPIHELFTDDNSDAMRTGHNAKLSFGQVGSRANVPLTIDGPNGPLTFTLGGSGTGSITIDAAGKIDITVNGSDASSVLSVKTGASGQFVDDITINSPIGAVKLGELALHGNFSAGGGAKSITLGSVGDAEENEDYNFSVNVFPVATQKLSLNFGTVHDYSLTSAMPVGKLIAANWFNDAAATGTNEIFLAGLSALRIAGNLEANVTVASDAKVGSFTVGGALLNATVKSFSDFGTVKLGSISGSNFFAGVNAQPDNLDDFELGAAISKFIVNGTFADSVVAAARINSMVIGNVDTSAGDFTKGVYADAIKSYVRKGVGAKTLKNLDAPGTFDASGNYEVRVF